MSRGAQTRIGTTRSIQNPNEYVKALYGEYASFCLDEVHAPLQKGHWRQGVFQLDDLSYPLDLEIGTGNGGHFAYRAQTYPQRGLIGLELKYKPLIQSIRRALHAKCHNARMVRFNAVLIDQLFASHEIDDVFIHFPDPWTKSSQQKHRLLQPEFWSRLWTVQKPGSWVEFKTDNQEYFHWALEKAHYSPYQLEVVTENLHKSEWGAANFSTQFEKIFLKEGLPIYYARFYKKTERS